MVQTFFTALVRQILSRAHYGIRPPRGSRFVGRAPIRPRSLQLCLALALSLLGCFGPSYQPGLPCSESENTCPPGQTCDKGVCQLALDQSDASPGSDTAPGMARRSAIGNVLYFDFDDRGTTSRISDRTGSSLIDGDRVGLQAEGFYGKGFRWEGALDQILLPAHPKLRVENQLTVESYVYLDHPDKGRTILVSEGLVTHYELSVRDDMRLAFSTNTGQCKETEFVSYSALTTGVWIHVAATWDANEVALYIDGSEDARFDASFAPCQQGETTVRAARGGSGSGGLDELKLSDYAKTAADIRNSIEYDSGATSFCGNGLIEGTEACDGVGVCCGPDCRLRTGESCYGDGTCSGLRCTFESSFVPEAPVIRYRFDDDGGTTIRDSGAHGYDLTIDDGQSSYEWTADGLHLSGPSQVFRDGLAAGLCDDSNELSIELWFEPDHLEAVGTLVILEDTGDINFTVAQWKSRVVGRIRSNEDIARTGRPLVTSSDALLSKRMYHVVITRAADGERRIYLDGALQSRNVALGDFDWPSARLALGDDIDGESPWEGTLAHLAAFCTALSEQTIARLFSSGLPP